jgi:hypothetical protein
MNLVCCRGNTRNMPDDAAEMKVIEKAGPSTPLRSGRDDKLMLRISETAHSEAVEKLQILGGAALLALH